MANVKPEDLQVLSGLLASYAAADISSAAELLQEEKNRRAAVAAAAVRITFPEDQFRDLAETIIQSPPYAVHPRIATADAYMALQSGDQAAFWPNLILLLRSCANAMPNVIGPALKKPTVEVANAAVSKS